MKFEDLKISESLKKALKESNYVETTEIQEKTIPLILEGRDIIGQSKTGTGKTASYALPVIENIDTSIKNTQAIILCPTRELAVQVTEEFRKFLKYQENIKCLSIYGGQSIERQILGLKKGIQIIIGTPGRIMDHMRRRTIKLDNVKIAVLDEADEMLNMGFEEDIETILKDIPETRQTLLFSATMNSRIMNITKKYLREPKNIKIKAEELTVNNIKQMSIEVKSKMKDETVIRLVEIMEPEKALIFCNTKKKVDELIEKLKDYGLKAESIHGDMKQNQRDRIMKKMKDGQIGILVATDVAARGIDIKNLDLVINYDIPQEQEYYVHRIGRTGRNGKDGVAYTLYTGKEKIKLKNIEKYANIKIKKGEIPTFKQVKEIRNKKVIENIQKIIDEQDFKNTEIIDKLIENGNEFEDISKALLTIILSTETKESKSENYEPDENGYVRLFLSVGKIDKIMVKDIVGSFTSNCAIQGDKIGRVNLLDKFSFIDIPAEYVDEVITCMKGKQIKGKDVSIEIASKK